MSNTRDVYLLTGSNINPRTIYMEEARKAIGLQIGLIASQSGIYESDPWGFDSETLFLNQVLRVKSSLSAVEILNEILLIENHLGRKRRTGAYSSRTIDIDILYYGNESINEPDLIVPHPRIQDRKFTLIPLNEIAAELKHPVLKLTSRELLKNTADKANVQLYTGKDGI